MTTLITGTMEHTGTRPTEGRPVYDKKTDKWIDAHRNVFVVTLHCEGRTETFDYFTGSAIEEIGLSDVVECLLLDAQMFENAGSAGELARDTGETDVDAALRTWDALRVETAKVRALIGGRRYLEWLDTADDIEALASENVEEKRYKRHGRWGKWYTEDEHGNMTSGARAARL